VDTFLASMSSLSALRAPGGSSSLAVSTQTAFICPSPLVYYNNESNVPAYHTIVAANDYCAVPCPTIEYTSKQWHVENNVVTILVIISFSLCFLVFLSHITEFYKYYIRIMFIGGFLVNSFIIGIFVILNRNDSIICDGAVYYVESGPFCVFQAAATVWTFIWTNTWSAILAYDTFLHVSLLSKPGSEFFARMKYTVIAVAISSIVTAVPLISGNLGFDPDANIPICLYMISKSPEVFWFSFVVPFYLLLLVSLILTILCAWRVHKVFITSSHYKTAVARSKSYNRVSSQNAIYTPLVTSDNNAGYSSASNNNSEAGIEPGSDASSVVNTIVSNTNYNANYNILPPNRDIESNPAVGGIPSNNLADGASDNNLQAVAEVESEASSSIFASNSASDLNAADIQSVLGMLKNSSFDVLNNSFCYTPGMETESNNNEHGGLNAPLLGSNSSATRSDNNTTKASSSNAVHVTPKVTPSLIKPSTSKLDIPALHSDEPGDDTNNSVTPMNASNRYSAFRGFPHTPNASRHAPPTFLQSVWQSLNFFDKDNNTSNNTSNNNSRNRTVSNVSWHSEEEARLYGNDEDDDEDDNEAETSQQIHRQFFPRHGKRGSKHSPKRNGRRQHQGNIKNSDYRKSQQSNASQDEDDIEGHVGVVGWICCCLCCRSTTEEDVNNVNSSSMSSSLSSYDNKNVLSSPRTSKRTSTDKQLEAAYLLSAIWNYNGRSILFVIVFCLTTIIVFPLDFDLFFVEFDEFRASSGSFVNCLVNASTHCSDQSAEGVQLCANQQCGTRPSDTPDLAQVKMLLRCVYLGLIFALVADAGAALLRGCIRDLAFYHLWIFGTDVHEILSLYSPFL
jgi:hypothetical protein